MQKGKKGSGKVGDGSEADIVKDFQLIVDETKVNSATVPVGFCLSKGFFKKIKKQLLDNRVWILVSVISESGKEKRYTYNVKDMFAYIPMIGYGVNTIKYSLYITYDYGEDDDAGFRIYFDDKEKKEKFLEKFLENGRKPENKFCPVNNSIEINMPEDYFSKNGKFLNWAEKYMHQEPGVDCDQRAMLLTLIPVLIFHGTWLVISIFIKTFIAMLILTKVLIGFRVNAKGLKKYIFHNKIMDFKWITKPKKKTILGVMDNNKEVVWLSMILSPAGISFIYISDMVLKISNFKLAETPNLSIITALILALFFSFVTAYIVFDYLYNSLLSIHKENKRKIDVENWKKVQEETKKEDSRKKLEKNNFLRELSEALTCTGVDGEIFIPEQKKTAFDRIKSKVCKTIAR